MKNINIEDSEPIAIFNKWSYTHHLSRPMNKLKGQLYSLIEASAQSREQSEATKKLVKGFCNDTYRDILDEMRWYLVRSDVLTVEQAETTTSHLLAEPLEVAQEHGI